MIKKGWVLTFTRRAVFLMTLSIIALPLLIFLCKTAHMQSAEFNDEKFPANLSEQNAVQSKLVFQRTQFFTTGSETFIATVNADGSGLRQGIGGPFPPKTDPAWSPDGTKIVYSLGDVELFVMNADGSDSVSLTNNGASPRESDATWSVTNKIAYQRDNQIWVMNADGSDQMPFPGITQPANFPSWSPDGAKLAFTSGGDIYIINADGTDQRRITSGAEAENNPSWSADGLRLVFSKGTSGIFVINTDGINEIRLTSGNDSEPVWSHDNYKIAFVRTNSPDPGIYVMNTDGSNQVRIVANDTNARGAANRSPAWQPVSVVPNTITIGGRITRADDVGLAGAIVKISGSAITTTVTDAVGNYQFSNLPMGGNYTVEALLANYYFEPAVIIVHNVNRNSTLNFTAKEMCQGIGCKSNGKIVFVRSSDIYLINSNGTNLINLTNSSATDTEPNWSPDGTEIVFSSNRSGNYELYTMKADGSDVVRLTDISSNESFPAFSPDGGKIVFVSDRDGNKEIYTINKDGSNLMRLTNNSSLDDQPSYSPDGSKIVFISRRNSQSSPRDIYVMSADGSNQTRLTVTTNTLDLAYPSFSPDGNKILFTGFISFPTESRAYTINIDGSNLTQISTFANETAYSPDGKKIIYTYCCSGFINGIYIKNTNGTGNFRLTDNGNSFSDRLPKWQPLQSIPRPTQFDFDGDRKADISVFNPDDGTWFLLNSSSGINIVGFGASTDNLAPADYDGDGKTDIAVFRENPNNPDQAGYFIQRSPDFSRMEVQFGANGDVPLSADFDGDGKSDLAVYRKGADNSQSYFLYRPSSQPGIDLVSIAFGLGEDKPVTGDFDGDGKTDIAVFRPSNGVWYIQKSTEGFFAVQFGTAEDKPVVGDYDADGRADIAVYRPSNGVWYLLQSGSGFAAAQFGTAEDLPVAADYDGDGRTDIAVYRPSNGVWYLLQSARGFAGVGLGTATDKPVENAFVP